MKIFNTEIFFTGSIEKFKFTPVEVGRTIVFFRSPGIGVKIRTTKINDEFQALESKWSGFRISFRKKRIILHSYNDTTHRYLNV